MIKGGLIYLDKKGEMQLTEKGWEHSEKLLIKPEHKEYMKQVAKHFTENIPSKETVNIKDIEDKIDMIDNTKLSIYERFRISENDDLKNYQLFYKLTETIANDPSNKNKGGFESMLSILSESKYFEVPDNINLLLQNTSNEIKKIRLPFFYVFLDTKLVVYDKTFYCLQIQDRTQLREIAIQKGLDVKNIPKGIDILTFWETSEGVGWNKIELYEKDRNKYHNKIREYVLNFVDFVNNEEVKLMFRERTEKNIQRRIQKGRIPLPSFNKIYLVGYLAKYLNKLETQELGTRFTHRFWVRGHYRRFLDKKKYKKLYEQYKKGELNNFEGKKYNIEKGFLKIWVLPYIKGEGMLIEKRYKLE